MRELPIACTLTPGAMADRGEWLRRLGSKSLRAGERKEDRLDLRFDPAARTRSGVGTGGERMLRFPELRSGSG